MARGEVKLRTLKLERPEFTAGTKVKWKEKELEIVERRVHTVKLSNEVFAPVTALKLSPTIAYAEEIL